MLVFEGSGDGRRQGMRKLCGSWGGPTTSLFQLIHRGIIMLVKVIAVAIESVSAGFQAGNAKVKGAWHIPARKTTRAPPYTNFRVMIYVSNL